MHLAIFWVYFNTLEKALKLWTLLERWLTTRIYRKFSLTFGKGTFDFFQLIFQIFIFCPNVTDDFTWRIDIWSFERDILNRIFSLQLLKFLLEAKKHNLQHDNLTLQKTNRNVEDEIYYFFKIGMIL